MVIRRCCWALSRFASSIMSYLSIARMAAGARSRSSRDPGLHRRKPVFPTARALAKDFDPYIDFEGCIKAFAVIDLYKELPAYDWRLSKKNVWKVEQMLRECPITNSRSTGLARKSSV